VGEEVCEVPARVLADRLRRREVSAVETLDAHLERIGRHNPALNAVVSLDADRAREQARGPTPPWHEGRSSDRSTASR
jgi:amidase